jgi:hypothetical protein
VRAMLELIENHHIGALREVEVARMSSELKVA